MQKWIILIVVFVIIFLAIFVICNINIETEYIPETEIADTELRKTIVTLYFKDKISGEIVKESKLIDSKELLYNPYKKMVNLLIEGPQNDNFERIIPENTKILEANVDKGILLLNFSNEILDDSKDVEQINESIKSIVNTVTQLIEVNGVKILVNNEETDKLLDQGIDFGKIYRVEDFTVN